MAKYVQNQMNLFLDAELRAQSMNDIVHNNNLHNGLNPCQTVCVCLLNVCVNGWVGGCIQRQKSIDYQWSFRLHLFVQLH